MHFQLNQSSDYKIKSIILALFQIFALSFMTAVSAYALSGIFVVVKNLELDIISFAYYQWFLYIFVVIFAGLVGFYIKSPKGAWVTDKGVELSIGHSEKHHKRITKIPFDSILSVEMKQSFLYMDTKKDYRNMNTTWLGVGIIPRLTPVVIVKTNKDINFVIALDDCDGFVREYIRTKNFRK